MGDFSLNEKWIISFFGEPEPDHFWWKIFTRHRSGYAHATALRYDPIHKVWLYVEWSRAGLVFETLTRERAVSFIDFMMKNAVNLEIEIEKRSRHRKFPPLILYCVSVIKELLAINAPLVWTPYQLKRHLERMGAKEVFK